MQMRFWLTSIVMLAACGGKGMYIAPAPTYVASEAAAPQPLTCSGGALPQGDGCVCPDGTQWDGTQCVFPVQEGGCYGGAVQSGDQCVCPDGTGWDGAQCAAYEQTQPSCPPGAYWDGTQCMCPPGAVWYGAQCTCPAGTGWDGAQCAALGEEAPPPDEGGGGGGGGFGAGGDTTITIERHASTDEIGKSCESGDGWPTAGGCQYGAVCYHKACTVWCSSDRTCPANMTCGATDTHPSTDLCQY